MNWLSAERREHLAKFLRIKTVKPPANPYQSPQFPSEPPVTVPVRPRISWRRGVLFAIAGGCYGFYIPLMAVLGIGWLMGIPVGRNPFRNFWGEILAGPDAYFACSALGAFAALLNFTPARRIGMISALRQVGAYAMLGLLLGVVLFAMLPGTPTYAYSPYRPHVLAVILLTIAGGGIYLTVQRVIRERSEPLGPLNVSGP